MAGNETLSFVLEVVLMRVEQTFTVTMTDYGWLIQFEDGRDDLRLPKMSFDAAMDFVARQGGLVG